MALRVLAVLLSATAPSCGVKEDRGPCPCLLTLSYRNALEGMTDSFRARVYREGFILSDETISLKLEPSEHVVKVVKGENRVCYFGGASSSVLEGDRLMIPKGQESDPLFIGSDMASCYGEKTVVNLDFRKEFCRLDLEIPNGTWEEYPYEMTLEGNVSGIDIRTLAPVEGSFSCKPSPSGGPKLSARIPRQKDSSLTLTLTGKKDGRVHSVPLGRLIEKSGYDWQKSSLDDITVGIDFASGDFSIQIAGWENGSIRDVDL